MDVVSLFSIIVFAVAWWFYARTPRIERVVKLFLAILMGMAATVGVLGILNRWIMASLHG